jgi:hypothetical protein
MKMIIKKMLLHLKRKNENISLPFNKPCESVFLMAFFENTIENSKQNKMINKEKLLKNKEDI